MRWGDWLIAGMCIAFIAAVLTPTGLYAGVATQLTSKDAAAWVQAYGSIGAIAGTGLLGFLQLRASRLAEIRQRVRAMQDECAQLEGVWETCLSAMMTGGAVLGPIIENANNPVERARWHRDIEPVVAPLVRAQEALGVFPAHALANARAYGELQHVRSNLHSAEMALRQFSVVGAPEDPSWGPAIGGLFTSAEAACRSAMNELRSEWLNVRNRFADRIAEERAGL